MKNIQSYIYMYRLVFSCCTWFLGVFFPLCSAYPLHFIPMDTSHPICVLFKLLKKTRTSAKRGSSAKAFYLMFMKLVLSYCHRNHLILLLSCVMLWYLIVVCICFIMCHVSSWFCHVFYTFNRTTSTRGACVLTDQAIPAEEGDLSPGKATVGHGWPNRAVEKVRDLAAQIIHM